MCHSTERPFSKWMRQIGRRWSASVILHVMERTRRGRLLRPHVRSSFPPSSLSFTQSPGRYGGIRVTCCRPSYDGFLRMIVYLPCVFQAFRRSGIRAFRELRPERLNA
jgi:hypothetical protein